MSASKGMTQVARIRDLEAFVDKLEAIVRELQRRVVQLEGK